jgi:hypothetical protein
VLFGALINPLVDAAKNLLVMSRPRREVHRTFLRIPSYKGTFLLANLASTTLVDPTFSQTTTGQNALAPSSPEPRTPKESTAFCGVPFLGVLCGSGEVRGGPEGDWGRP